ncbi:PQQ-dependent sugar dehydrogenase [Thiohalorhabdus methylotrophus]|uniref:PQQ-dependent sugar dehydrogenase n=1 Tax=Thiohalorhabdus methylotrophus TaxID=3242694 RepID=A0ABV4TT12_9GAMM
MEPVYQPLLRRRALPYLLAALVLLLGFSTHGCAVEVGPEPQSVDDVYVPEPEDVRVSTWVANLEVPWSLAFLPGGQGDALVTERPGRVRLIRGGTLQEAPYAELEVYSAGEAGLMGIALHPDFPGRPYVYLMHTYEGPSGLTNRVVRLRHRGDHGELDRVILDGIPGGRFHDGGRIAFGPDGMLYVTAGETFERQLAQQRSSLAGKILRVTPEGKIPPDNPIPGSPVYSLGHRNPQGLAWDPRTGALLASEHGPSGEMGLQAHDELNVLRKGGNYGWPEVVGAPEETPFINPITAWPENTTPPAGMTFHKGDLFVATLGSEALLHLRLRRDGDYRIERIERWFRAEDGASRFGRLRAAVEGPDGALYVLTSNRDGRGRPRQSDDRILRMDIPGRP